MRLKHFTEEVLSEPNNNLTPPVFVKKFTCQPF